MKEPCRFTLLFLPIIALLRRFVERKVINRKHFSFWSLKNWTFSVLSFQDRHLQLLIDTALVRNTDLRTATFAQSKPRLY